MATYKETQARIRWDKALEAAYLQSLFLFLRICEPFQKTSIAFFLTYTMGAEHKRFHCFL